MSGDRHLEIETILGDVFDDLREGMQQSLSAEEYSQRKQEFTFHMLDWESDLADFGKLLAEPSAFTRESASKLVVGFLYHVVPHLQAASNLLLDTKSP